MLQILENVNDFFQDFFAPPSQKIILMARKWPGKGLEKLPSIYLHPIHPIHPIHPSHPSHPSIPSIPIMYRYV